MLSLRVGRAAPQRSLPHKGGGNRVARTFATCTMSLRAPLRKPHRIDRRQRVGHAGPAVALVLAHPESARGRAEREPIAWLIERERVAVDDVIGMGLRQPLAQDLEALAAIACARNR